jgi:hypothetical protein
LDHEAFEFAIVLPSTDSFEYFAPSMSVLAKRLPRDTISFLEAYLWKVAKRLILERIVRITAQRDDVVDSDLLVVK